MTGTDYHCPHCGAELRGGARRSGSPPGGKPGCPYDGMAYAALRAGHDAIYFGRWRRIDAPPTEIRRGYHRIGRHLDAIGAQLAGHDLPAAARDLDAALAALHAADPREECRDTLRFMDNALSYAHRAIDDLLHEKGLPPHQPMDFSEWYDVVEVPFRDEW
ncbi:MAG: hypothetical protein H6Q82_3 [Deltaproteobacteria bacterium]|nr:hypothetical protein [Deltaproteobacteria bacterium]MBP2681976.1 hypothetical protein [Deltaproteobacteria bacterium]